MGWGCSNYTQWFTISTQKWWWYRHTNKRLRWAGMSTKTCSRSPKIHVENKGKTRRQFVDKRSSVFLGNECSGERDTCNTVQSLHASFFSFNSIWTTRRNNRESDDRSNSPTFKSLLTFVCCNWILVLYWNYITIDSVLVLKIPFINYYACPLTW